MRRLLTLFAVLLSGPAGAQPAEKELRSTVEIVVWIVETATYWDVAAEACGDVRRSEWSNVIAAVDKRFRICVTQDAGWKMIAGGFSPLEEQSVAQGSSRSLGSFIADSKRPFAVAELKRFGKQHYCAVRPWKLVLQEQVTEEDKAEYRKVGGGVALETEMFTQKFIVSLGIDTAWVDLPCDRFIPMIGSK